MKLALARNLFDGLKKIFEQTFTEDNMNLVVADLNELGQKAKTIGADVGEKAKEFGSEFVANAVKTIS